MQTCVIANPSAGSANLEMLTQALATLADAELRVTSAPEDTGRYAREAVTAGCELVVAAGGDGTINAVVNGIAPDFARVRLGILPLGTGNDLARSLAVPTDLAQALALLQTGPTRPLDLVRVTSTMHNYFINVSAGGFSGLVDDQLTEEMKRSWGPLAYVRSAAQALPDLTSYETEITFDDEPAERHHVYNIVVANARFVAGGWQVAPEALLDDGLLDVVLIPAASVPQLLLLMPQLLQGKHLDSDLLTFRRARKLQVDSRPGMWFNVDGELVGNEPAIFEVLPQALQVIVGPDAPALINAPHS